MLRFTGEIDGIPVLDRAFNRVEAFIADFRNIFPSVAQVVYAVEREQFATEGAHGATGRWHPLSVNYAKYKAIAFPGMPILRATTSLYESMTSPDAPDSIFRMTENELTIGTQREGARAHQRGGGNLPARPIIALTESDKRRIQKAIQSGLVQFTRGLGFQAEEKAA